MLREEERRELETLRDALAQRREELDDQVRNGTLTDEQRDALLAQEYGADWLATLSELNQLLHHRSRAPHHHAIAAFTVVAVSIVLLVLLASPAMTGLAGGEHTLQTRAVLFDGDTARLQATGTITDVTLSYEGPGSFTLFLDDATSRATLASGTAQDYSCNGCGNQYEPPLMLTAQTSGGSITVTSITYEED